MVGKLMDPIMVGVLFVYGLVFFNLGLITLLYPKTGSGFKLAKDMWLVGAFGLFHGINVWVEMVILIQEPVEIWAFNVIKLFVFPISFLFLVHFGSKIVSESKEEYSRLKVLPVVLPVVWSFLTLMSRERFLMGDIFARYLLGIPGVILTAYALILQISEIEKQKMFEVVLNVQFVAGLFLVYGFFSGFIVPEGGGFFPASYFNNVVFLRLVGLPVQVFRTFIGLLMTYGMIQVLTIFDRESLLALKAAHIELENEIVEHKKAEEALCESEEKYRGLVESTVDWVWTIDREGRTTYSNEAIKQLLGYDVSEILGVSIFTLMGPEDQETIRDMLQASVKGKRGWRNVAIRWIHKDGSVRFFESAAQPILDAEGGLLGFSGIDRDITDRRLVEAALERYSDELEESNKFKDLFIDIMRHDLLNPASAASSMADVALKFEKDPKKREVLSIIYSSTKRMIDMIENASVLARLESIESFEMEDSDLGVVLRNVVEDVKPLAADRKIQITSYVDGKYEASVNPLVSVVFSNLVKNAIKFSPEGSEVVVGIEESGSVWKIFVSDRGEGVPDGDKRAVFERFNQVKTNVKGTGLGLAIVQKIIDAHSGRVWIEDNPGKGSIFYVTLPKK